MFNTPPPLSRRTKIIILLLVLLLHLLLLIPFLNVEFTFLPESKLKQKVEELHKKIRKHKKLEPEQEEWATLKSQATQMSAPVILVDDQDEDIDPSTLRSFDKTQDQGERSSLSKTLASDLDKQDSTDALSPQAIALDIPTDDTQSIEQETKQDKEEKPIETEQVETQQIETPPIDTQHIETRPMATRPINIQPAEKKLNPQPKQKPRAQKATQQSSQKTKRPTMPKPPQQQKPKLSLAQLAQGFTDHMKHEGDYTIAMTGNDNAKATESQLKIGRFLQRIIASIQNAWRANISRYPLSHPVIISIHFTIVINKNGTLNKVGIDQSSGDRLVDNYIASIIQDASSSFPPIPDYMSHDICSIRCTLEGIRLPEGPPGYTIRQ